MKESCIITVALLGCTASKDCLLTQESKADLISANCSTFCFWVSEAEQAITTSLNLSGSWVIPNWAGWC